MSKVYIILNEMIYRGKNGTPITEIVQPIHRTLEGAITALVEIAEDAGVDMTTGEDEHSVYLPTRNTPYESDEYYIEGIEIVD